MNSAAKYRRVLIKISGEILGGEGGPLNRERLAMVAESLKAVLEMGVQTAVVVGGGNIVRGLHAAEINDVDRVTADHMGMLSTAINGLALMDKLEQLGCATRVMSAIPMDRLAEPYILRRATHHLDKGRIVIFVAGTGNPYFSTDTAAALRASEIGAEVLIKATKVDGIYTADPKKDPRAKKFEKLTFDECVQQNLRVMDPTAFTMCRENKMPILVLNLFEQGALIKAVSGEKVGTRVG
jgi:uridylate kinase